MGFGDKGKAVEWLSKAHKARLKPKIITYNVVIGACAKSGDMEKSVDWLSKAQEARLKPDIITYSAVIDVWRHGEGRRVVIQGARGQAEA